MSRSARAQPHRASDELILVAVIALIAVGSLVMIAPSDTSDTTDDSVTGTIVLADREGTLPQHYSYQGALQRGKSLPKSNTGCAVCAGGTLRPGMSQVYQLCTGDYAVRLNMVSSMTKRALFDVNGELFDTSTGDRITLRDGMNVQVKGVNAEQGGEQLQFEMGSMTYTSTAKPGDTLKFSLCDKSYSLTVNSVESDPKTVHLTVNGNDFVMAPGEARPLKSGKTLFVLSIDAQVDRWGSVTFEIA